MTSASGFSLVIWLLQAGNIRSKDINEFINSKLRRRLRRLPSTATQILIFRTDFPRSGVASRLASRQPRVSEGNCEDEYSLRKGGVRWTLTNDLELLVPSAPSLSDTDTLFLQVRYAMSYMINGHDHLTIWWKGRCYYINKIMSKYSQYIWEARKWKWNKSH